jgi:anhydro-N-acetylmuramic acid kinase
MSGTSLDGIDAALLHTDGEAITGFGPDLTMEYEPAFREKLHAAIAGTGDLAAVERELTLLHAEAVTQLLQYADMHPREIGIIGFHGQTIAHRPHEGITRQLGDGALLAECTGINVVNDFRRRDVAAGGQGAPLVPLYHAALTGPLPKPLAVLNIGGVANVTWVGADGTLLAFDTGPGNALINDWVHAHTGNPYDHNGDMAGRGRAHEPTVAKALNDPFFRAVPPKSLDRNAFAPLLQLPLSPEDGAATLTAFTAAAVAQGLGWLPETPLAWYVCGGGRHNPILMRELRARLNAAVHSVDTLDWQGDALEAQAFAFLAVRSLRGLPLSLPSTTGVRYPVTGGALHRV